MKFEYVRRTLINNEKEAPSLYLALCIIESLIEDLETETNMEVADIPMGEDQVPTQLISLCNTIQEIYCARSDDLIRNRSRLDAAIGKLKDTEKNLEAMEEEFEQIAEVEKKYQKAQERSAQLEEEKRRLQQTERTYRDLTEQIRQLEAEIEPLIGSDGRVQEANIHLAELLEQRSDLIKQVNDFQKQIRQITEQMSEMEKQSQLDHNKIQMLTAKKSEMQQQEKEIQEQGQKYELEVREYLQNLEDKKSALNNSIREYKVRQEEAIQHQALLESEMDSLRKELAEYQDTVITPLEEEIAASKAKLQQKNEEREELEKALADQKAEKYSLVYLISKRQIELDKLNLEHEEKQTAYDATEMKYKLLHSELVQLETEQEKRVEELGELQNSVTDLKEARLPELMHYVESERALLYELTESVTLLGEEKISLTTELEEKRQKAEELDQNVSALKASIEVLTARCTDTDVQLKKLTDQVQELTGKTDEEKVRMRREQLEDRIRELHKLENEYEKLELRLKDTERRLEEACEKRRLLNIQRDETESAEQQILGILKTLEPINTPAYIERSKKAAEQLKFLMSVQNNLFDSIRRMREILHLPEAKEEKELLAMKEQFSVLKEALDAYQNTLVACTDFTLLERS